MKKILLTATAALLLILGASSSQTAAVCEGACDGNVPICHASDSHTNPYVAQAPNIQNDGSLSGGHLNHTGAIWYQGIADHSWGDIIPPYIHGEFNYPGMNWTSEGQAIWRNGCSVPEASPSPSVAPSPTASPSPEVSPSPQSSPSPESSPTPSDQIVLELGIDGPECNQGSFHVSAYPKINGMVKSGVKVEFQYSGTTKYATTSSPAEVDFEFKGNGKVAAKADGYPAAEVGVESSKGCPTGSAPEALGAATTAGGQVLGAMAETGSPLADLANLVFSLGAGLIGLGAKTYAKKNR